MFRLKQTCLFIPYTKCRKKNIPLAQMLKPWYIVYMYLFKSTLYMYYIYDQLFNCIKIYFLQVLNIISIVFKIA